MHVLEILGSLKATGKFFWQSNQRLLLLFSLSSRCPSLSLDSHHLPLPQM